MHHHAGALLVYQILAKLATGPFGKCANYAYTTLVTVAEGGFVMAELVSETKKLQQANVL
jgi:hypothetical protein